MYAKVLQCIAKYYNMRIISKAFLRYYVQLIAWYGVEININVTNVN